MLEALREYRRTVSGRDLIIQTGWLAGQANGAVTVRYGDTVVLVTACMGQVREGGDFLPLTVDYEERLYAAGKIPGSFFRREGRPSQEAILAARLTDRSIRPLFPKGFRNEVQVVATVLSADQENPPDILALIGASTALGISDIPFEGPLAACRMGLVDGELVVNPTFAQLERSDLDLVVASTRDAVVMLEAGAREVPEDRVMEAIRWAHQVNQEVLDLIDQVVREVGRPKMAFKPPEPPPQEVVEAVRDLVADRLDSALYVGEKAERNEALEALQQEAVARLGEQYPQEQIAQAFKNLVRQRMRTRILEEGVRPDGRRPTEIRPIYCAVGILPRTHGSGLFVRGQTQVLTIATLGSLGMEQELDTLSPEETKRFIHHYNFPPFSTGEVRRIGSPGRREIGHGALAERALEPVIPSEEEFPYTIRLVSEVLSSNGSTSMGSACGSTLALMDAGVPIKAPVGGISIGLIKEGERYTLLTDIQGIEDFEGDMDFKVAGTRKGITAIQLDIKIKGLDFPIIEETLARAREARLYIIDRMLEVLPAPRESLSPYAPRMVRLQIPVEKIGAVIGAGGRTIRSITERTGTTIDVMDDGTVYIGSPNDEAIQKAREIIEALTRDVEVGQVYKGRVTRITPFGVFVEILPGKEGLIRLSELSHRRVNRPEDEVQVGDEVEVKVIEIDHLGRINLSRKAVLPAPERAPEPAGARPQPGKPAGGKPPARPPQRPSGPPPRPSAPPARPGEGPPRVGPGRPPPPPPPRPGTGPRPPERR